MEIENNQPTHAEEGTAGEAIVEGRDDAQEEQLKAHARGDTGGELGAFVKEVLHDHAKFPSDVVEDARDPERRVDEEQGTRTHPASEPS